MRESETKTTKTELKNEIMSERLKEGMRQTVVVSCGCD